MPFSIVVRRQNLSQDGNRRTVWEIEESEVALDPGRTALLLCDVWDSHWCRGAVERLEAMIPRMNETTSVLRDRGVRIVHAPSGTMDVYADTPARQRITSVRQVDPVERELDDPPLPIDASDEGSDTGEKESSRTWSSQHAGIDIDQDSDVISDSGREIYSYFKDQSIETMLIFGVHTNMCVLHRSFGIKQMVRWGIDPILVRDLTDTMYNPAMPPYVSHEAGTDLVVGYIEKFWCPTTTSADLIG